MTMPVFPPISPGSTKKDSPTIAGEAADPAVNDNATLPAFSTLTVTDQPDNQLVAMTVTIVKNSEQTAATSAPEPEAGARRRPAAATSSAQRLRHPGERRRGGGPRRCGRWSSTHARTPSPPARPNRPRSPSAWMTAAAAIAIAIPSPPSPPRSTTARRSRGQAANQAVNDNATLGAFSTLTVANNPDNELVAVTVTIVNGANRGDFDQRNRKRLDPQYQQQRHRLQPHLPGPGEHGRGGDHGGADASLRPTPRTPSTPAPTKTTWSPSSTWMTAARQSAMTIPSPPSPPRSTTARRSRRSGQPGGQRQRHPQRFQHIDGDLPGQRVVAVTVTIVNGVDRGDFTAGSATDWTRSTSGSDIVYSRTFPARRTWARR